MEQLNMNTILNRTDSENQLKNILSLFELEKHLMATRRGVYIYGSPGTGKTCFVKDILKKLNYDVVLFDAGDFRNKTVIDTITKHNMADTNILSLFKKKTKKLAIIMDEIDGMNSGDKGGINSLIKLIRPKKTKKQKKEDITMIPIICIGNYHIDKKIKEMMKVCLPIELKTPTTQQVASMVKLLMPKLDPCLLNNVTLFIQGDLRKLKSTFDIYINQQSILKNKLIHTMFQPKAYNEDTKVITKKLLNNKYNINDHIIIMNETDRTSVGLLFHENIIDVLKGVDKKDSIPFYIDILKNICFADYIDRITFQKQIWIFNEMSSLVKTFYNNKLYHDKYGPNVPVFNPPDVRFTKVLTKYSTEYNNMLFIQNLCNQLNMDKKDMFSFFIDLREKYKVEEIYELFDNENYNINKLDVNRIYRYLDSYTKID
uniref:AAA+ ATPase domain-containing protein n=1 Tax=viral metagenome TaxID=1070528 RepID=A0A6C0C450_9ZZZZ